MRSLLLMLTKVKNEIWKFYGTEYLECDLLVLIMFSQARVVSYRSKI